jgi:hypothetical protein
VSVVALSSRLHETKTVMARTSRIRVAFFIWMFPLFIRFLIRLRVEVMRYCARETGCRHLLPVIE